MAAARQRIELVENGVPRETPMPTEVGMALAASSFVDCSPAVQPGRWVISPRSRVGAVRVGDLEVHVAPKILIDRVIFLLGYSSGVRWQAAPVEVRRAPDLLSAMVEAFSRVTERALLQGLVQGYRPVEDALPVVRGRIREAEQIRRRYSAMVPVEVRYDDFTVDTPENRLLRAAVLRSLRLPGLSRPLRHRLRRLDVRLADVTPIRAPGLLEPWRPSRLNARLHDALRLAELVVAGTSFELGGEGLPVHGLVVDLARVFEDFVCAALCRELRAIEGTTHAQDRWHLDVDREVDLWPDLVWYRADGLPLAVVDAKYKAERPSGFPHADLYQLLAYCTALGLPVGHLVYAQGNEQGHTHVVAGSGVILHAHTLDLTASPAELLEQVAWLGKAIGAAARVV